MEVMIALGIFSVAFLALFNTQGVAQMGALRAQKISIATQLAREKMARSIIEFEAGILKGEFPEDREESGAFDEENHPEYRWKLSVRKMEIPPPPVPEGGSETLRQVFTVVAKELSQSTREIRLTVWEESDQEEKGLVVTTHVVKM